MPLPRTPESGKKSKKKQTPKKKTPKKVTAASATPVEENAKKLGGDEKVVTPISKQLQEQRKKEIVRKMDEQLKALVRQREAVNNKLKRVKMATKTSAAQPNVNLEDIDFLEQQVKIVEDCYRQFGEYQSQIYSLALSVDQCTEHEACEMSFEELYNALTIELKRLIRRLTKPADAALAPPPPTSVIVPQYLPPLNVPLPTFDGSYETWFSYKSMFQSVMARYQAESPAIKLYHLRNSLVGKATGVIDQDIINNNDYDAAWALLVERFEDKRTIIDKHIEAVFALPKLSRDNVTELRELIDTCVKNIEALKTHELPVNGLGEQMLVNLLASRMDLDTRKAWESGQRAGVLPTYAATITFLKEKCRVLERLESSGASKGRVQAQKSVALVISRGAKCSLCNQQHDLRRCEQFITKSINERYSYLRRQGMCFNCLKKGHCAAGCTTSNSCKECGKRHHTTLHTAKQETTSITAAVDAPRPENENRGAEKQTLLTTAVVQVYDADGVPHSCRALIDSCSQNHFITERFANKLAIQKKRADCEVSVLNGGTTRIRHLVRTTIKSRVSPFSTELELLVIPRIIDDMPQEPIDVRSWNLPPNIELADPKFHSKGHIDLLLGAEVFWDLIKSGKINLAENLPSLRNTEFGWVVGGVLPSRTQEARTFCGVVMHGTRVSKRFEARLSGSS